MQQFPEYNIELPTRLQTPREFINAIKKHQSDLLHILESGLLLDQVLGTQLQMLYDYMETVENPNSGNYNGQLHSAYTMLIGKAKGDAEGTTIDFTDLSSDNCVKLTGSKNPIAHDAVLEYMKFVTRCIYIGELKDKICKVEEGTEDES